jgi:hypothetical protein
MPDVFPMLFPHIPPLRMNEPCLTNTVGSGNDKNGKPAFRAADLFPIMFKERPVVIVSITYTAASEYLRKDLLLEIYAASE